MTAAITGAAETARKRASMATSKVTRMVSDTAGKSAGKTTPGISAARTGKAPAADTRAGWVPLANIKMATVTATAVGTRLRSGRTGVAGGATAAAMATMTPTTATAAIRQIIIRMAIRRAAIPMAAT